MKVVRAQGCEPGMLLGAVVVAAAKAAVADEFLVPDVETIEKPGHSAFYAEAP